MAERPRPCACAPELRRTLLFPARDFSVEACTRCGAVQGVHTQYGYPEHPKAELELLGYHSVSLTDTLRAWLTEFPRYVPCSSPYCFVAAARRFEREAELRDAERQAEATQSAWSPLQRLQAVGVPVPLPFDPAGDVAPFQAVARACTLAADMPLPELLALCSGQSLAAEIAREQLAQRPTLVADLVTGIARGGKLACAVAEAVFYLRPSDGNARRALATAMNTRLLELCRAAFPEESEVSADLLALVILERDAAPAADGVAAVAASKLYPLRSTLRDHVAKIQRALS